MSEQNDVTTSLPESPQPVSAPVRPSWKDRVYGVRSVAAVAVAGLIIGGGAGAAIHAATADEGGRTGRPGFGGPGQGGPGGGFGGPGQMQGGPGQMQGGPGGQQQPPGGMPAPPHGLPGQTPPSVAPNDRVDPDTGDDTTSGDKT